MQDARVRIALLVICLACLLGSGLVLLGSRRATLKPIVISAPPTADAADAGTLTTPALKPAGRLYVDVAGAVRRPSLYILPSESRVMQAILAAGGPAADADLDSVNLAEKVTDGEKIFVPKRSTAPAASAFLPPAAPSPTASTPPAAPIKIGKGSSGSSSRSRKITAESGEQVALNSATAEDLERLPSIGPSMAARILAYRQQAGGFSKIEDLTQVTGIGPKKFAKIAPFVKLN